MVRVVVIAGEASGDRLGASFIRSARALCPDIKIEGVAGPLMRAEGCEAWFDSQDLAVMGVVDVVRNLRRILRIKRAVQQRMREDPPDVLLGIDAPDFNLRVEKFARRNGIKTAHYVCPSVWAWREGRVRILRKACDRILCLLPFEPEFLARHRIVGEFVGHPLADEIPLEPDQAAARQEFEIGSGPVVTIMPGSRGGEVARIGPFFARAAEWLNNRVEGISFIVPAVTPDLRDLIAAQFGELAPAVRVDIVDGRSHLAIAAADAVLTASGTAALEVMLSGRPMVVAYRLATFNYYGARFLQRIGVMKLEYFSLPNLLAGRPLVPELLQGQVTAETMGTEMLKLLYPSPQRDELIETFADLRARLSRSAGDRSARVVLELAGSLNVIDSETETGK